MKDISAKVILEWQKNITTLTYKNKGGLIPYSYKYKRNLRSYLRTILNYAEKYYKIPSQLKYVDNFRNTEKRKEMLIWTPEEFFNFIKYVENPVYSTFFYSLYFTGARKGEILASTWDDWDLGQGTLNINKSVTKKSFDRSWVVTIPKNESSIRKINIPSILTSIIKEYKKGRENYKFVFADEKPLADSNIERFQSQACVKAGVKKIRIHDFRHSHASLLLSQGVSVVAVAKRLGHSNIEQTLNTYAHLMPSEDLILTKILQETADKFNSNIPKM